MSHWMKIGLIIRTYAKEFEKKGIYYEHRLIGQFLPHCVRH